MLLSLPWKALHQRRDKQVLPKKNWESRVTSIKEVQDLVNLSTDVLIGKLLTHELSIKQRGEEQIEKEDKRKAITLKVSRPNLGSHDRR